MDAREYWNSYYQANSFKDGKIPSDFLRTNLNRLSKGVTLDVAMGEGINATFLASQGFKVKGIDIADVAVERAKALALDMNVELDTIRSDLDLHMFGLMEYDCIIMQNFKPSITRYYNEIIRALKQGGTLLIESPMVKEMTEALGKEETYRDFYFNSNEILREIFPHLRIIFYQETKVNQRWMIQCLAEKPVDRDAVKYGFFDISSKANTEHSTSSKQIELAEKLFKK